MATSYGNPPVVTNGLILCLDSGNQLSYPGSGANWNDLSNKKLCTLFNTPTFSTDLGGVLNFNGTDEYGEITTRDTSLEFQPNQPFTCFCIYKSPVDINQKALIANMINSSNFAGWDIWFNSSNTIAMHLIADWNSTNAIKIKVDYDGTGLANKWVSFGYTYDGSTPTNPTTSIASVDFYLNGQLTESNKSIADLGDGFSSPSQTITYNASQRFRVASRWASGVISNPAVVTTGVILIYNRKLSASEMDQNYQSLRKRFSI